MSTRTHEGYVKTYKIDRGFGFCKITSPPNQNLDIFFHASNLPPGFKVAEGDRLSFNIEQDERSRRYKAVDIQVVA